MLFEYTYYDGTNKKSDVLENPDTIFELIFVRDSGRFNQEKIRPHMSHPKHEEVMKNLPKNLNILRAEGTKCRTWPNLPISIHECYLSGNHYLSLPDLSIYTNLIVLELNDNSIEAIERPLPPTLARLNLDCNALRRFNKALVPPSCASITTFSNPGDFFSRPIVRQVLPWERQNEPPEEKPKNVYVNAHNVHDSGVQKSTKANILYLVAYKQDIPEDTNLWTNIDSSYASFWSRVISGTATLPGTILKSYAKNPYIMHGVQFTTLVDRVWLRIVDTVDKETKVELMKRFSEEVNEGNGNCLNGMMVRLVNVFLGFDPNIVVKLNVNQILGARIPATQERVRREMNLEEGKDTAEFWLRCYKETLKDLAELEVEYEQHEPWIMPLTEPILDDIIQKNNWLTCERRERPPMIETTQDVRKSVFTFLKEAGLEGYPWETQYVNDKWSAGVGKMPTP